MANTALPEDGSSGLLMSSSMVKLAPGRLESAALAFWWHQYRSSWKRFALEGRRFSKVLCGSCSEKSRAKANLKFIAGDRPRNMVWGRLFCCQDMPGCDCESAAGDFC